MKMIGLKDASTTATDLHGRMSILNFKKDSEIDVPDDFAGIAQSVGYARPVEDEPDGA
jgi:hypothetical protein